MEFERIYLEEWDKVPKSVWTKLVETNCSQRAFYTKYWAKGLNSSVNCTFQVSILYKCATISIQCLQFSLLGYGLLSQIDRFKWLIYQFTSYDAIQCAKSAGSWMFSLSLWWGGRRLVDVAQRLMGALRVMIEIWGASRSRQSTREDKVCLMYILGGVKRAAGWVGRRGDVFIWAI